MTADSGRFIDKGRSLLIIGSELQQLPEVQDLTALRDRIVDELKRFEHACAKGSISEEWTMVARFALCAFLDEQILRTPWGSASDWSKYSLLEELHGDSRGGDTFFELIERLRPEGQKYQDILELFCVCLRLGFRGRYARMAGGDAELNKLIRSLTRELNALGASYTPPLSVHWEGQVRRGGAGLRDLPLWIWGSAAMLMLLGVGLALTLWLDQSAAPLLRGLASLSRS